MHPSAEDEYFARQDLERIRDLAETRNAAVAREERERLRRLHAGKCPGCGLDLHRVPYRGVMIDRCFECRAIWLDDVELEKVAGRPRDFIDNLVTLFKIK